MWYKDLGKFAQRFEGCSLEWRGGAQKLLTLRRHAGVSSPTHNAAHTCRCAIRVCDPSMRSECVIRVCDLKEKATATQPVCDPSARLSSCTHAVGAEVSFSFLAIRLTESCYSGTPLPLSLTHALTPPSPTPSLTLSLSHSPSHLLPPSPTLSLTLSLSHSLTR